jgi:hypothetical protein
LAFMATNKKTVGARSESLRYPGLKTPFLPEQTDKLIKAHKDKLEKQRLLATAAARGEAAASASFDEAPAVREFQPAGLAMLGADPAKKAKPFRKGLAAGKAAAVPPAKVARAAPGTPGAAAAGNGASPPASSSARVVTSEGGDDWKKVDPQSVLEGHDTVGKKLNGAHQITHVQSKL